MAEQIFVAVGGRGIIRTDVRNTRNGDNPCHTLRRKTKTCHQRQMTAGGSSDNQNAPPVEPLKFRNGGIQEELSGLQAVVAARGPRHLSAETVVDVVHRHAEILTEIKRHSGKTAFIQSGPSAAVNQQSRFCRGSGIFRQVEISESPESMFFVVRQMIDHIHAESASPLFHT